MLIARVVVLAGEIKPSDFTCAWALRNKIVLEEETDGNGRCPTFSAQAVQVECDAYSLAINPANVMLQFRDGDPAILDRVLGALLRSDRGRATKWAAVGCNFIFDGNDEAPASVAGRMAKRLVDVRITGTLKSELGKLQVTIQQASRQFCYHNDATDPEAILGHLRNWQQMEQEAVNWMLADEGMQRPEQSTAAILDESVTAMFLHTPEPKRKKFPMSMPGMPMGGGAMSPAPGAGFAALEKKLAGKGAKNPRGLAGFIQKKKRRKPAGGMMPTGIPKDMR